MRTTLSQSITRRRTGAAAALIAAIMAAAALIPLLNASEDPPAPPPPIIFYGEGYEDLHGGALKVMDMQGQLVASTMIPSEDAPSGAWHVEVYRDRAPIVDIEINLGEQKLISRAHTVLPGFFAEVSRASFVVVPVEPEPEPAPAADVVPVELDSIDIRIIARRVENGRIEFGLRGPDGEARFPTKRFFREYGFGHNRWLNSSLIDLGDGYRGRIVARSEDRNNCIALGTDGPGCRTEFGFRVEGYEDAFPARRYFPAPGTPDHTRWLRSSEIPIFPVQ